MVRLSKSGNQYRITIPSEVISAVCWNENTELIFVPLLKDPSEKIGKNTPFYIKEVEKNVR